MEKKKITLIVLNSSYGGAEKHVYDLVRMLDREKYSINLITTNNNKLALLVNNEVCTYRIPRGLNSIFRMRKIIKDINPDIIHMHSPRATFLGMLSVIGLNKNLVVTAHGWIPERLKLKRIYEKLFIVTIRRSSKIIAVSEQVKEQLIKNRVNEKKISVIYNGINITSNFNVSQPKKIENKIRFVFLGRFIEEKGIQYLLKAIEKLEKKYINKFVVDFYGSGPLEEEVKKTVTVLDLKSVNINGFVEPENVINILQKYDVFLMPSIQEGFPYTLIEALSTGLIVLASDVGGISDAIKNGENGYLLKPKDPEDIFKKMEIILNSADYKIKNMKVIAYRSSLNFTLQKMIKSLEEVYNNL